MKRFMSDKTDFASADAAAGDTVAGMAGVMPV